MSSDAVSRVQYFDKQFLRVDEFRDEQLYQLALRRRHNITQHTWGIVSGLELAVEEGGVVVRPGVAIDGYGRELLLDEKFALSPEAFDDLGTDRVDVWLVYGRQNEGSAPDGYGDCSARSGGLSYRSSEVPQVLVERPVSNQVDARRPPGVAPEVLNAPVPPTTDDPRNAWRVYLGRVIRIPDQPSPSLDVNRRLYAGIVAESIDHPGNATRVDIGRQGMTDAERTVNGMKYIYHRSESSAAQRRFAVFIPDDAAPVPGDVDLVPRFEILSDGIIRLRGRTIVKGDLRVSGGAVRFVGDSNITDQNAPQEPSIYHTADQMRIDLGVVADTDRTFAIGFSTADGKFMECLRIELHTDSSGNLRPLVTLKGNLKVDGKLTGDFIRQGLTPAAQAALLGSFQSGVAANNSP